MTCRQYAVKFTATEQAELTSQDVSAAPPAPDEVRGQTLYTLISAGTEIAHGYTGKSFPYQPGYAATFQVEEVGREVEGIKEGDRLFCMGPHRSWQQVKASDTLPVPAGLPPEKAVMARLMGITMSTLATTMARPPDKVMVMGLGPVGFLGSQTFRSCGYEVLVCEPNQKRRTFALQSGLQNVYPTPPVDDPTVARKVALVLECSGHEQAVLDGCRVVRKRGEIVLVGTPWRRRTDTFAQELLNLVFFNYVTLRSGWEWELPTHAVDFRPHSIFSNFAAALQWLREGRVQVDGLYAIADPHDAQQVYQELLHYRWNRLFALFDWSRCRE